MYLAEIISSQPFPQIICFSKASAFFFFFNEKEKKERNLLFFT